MIALENLCFSVGSFALNDVSLSIDKGEYFVLLGPTGSGKTLLIECLCGLNRIDSGRIVIEGTDVSGFEPRRRGIGYLPQDYALFPHKTVRQNVAFGLRGRGLSCAAIVARVDTLLEQLEVTALADRLPRKLSGGEKQRVALARALAIRPRVLVLDEPVSALDEQTRATLCRLLKRLQQETGTTTIHVCHGFAEMLTVADRVGIVQQGKIVQVGTPREILERPVNVQAAEFVRAGNLLSAEVRANGAATEEATTCLTLDGVDGLVLRAMPSDATRYTADNVTGNITNNVTVVIRPENIRLHSRRPNNLPPETSLLAGRVEEIMPLGPLVHVCVRCGANTRLLVSHGSGAHLDCGIVVGDHVFLSVAAKDVHIICSS